LFSKKAKEIPDLYDIRPISVNELDRYPDGIRNMQDNKVDGFIIKNALSLEEVELVDKAVRALPNQDLGVYHHQKGFAYPRPFSNLGAEVQDAEKFFRELGNVRSISTEYFEVDLESRLFDILGKMGGGRKINAPVPKNIEGSSMPFGIRYLSSSTGVLEVHCGNLFHDRHSAFYDHIQDVDAFNQLSFFFMIQPSESSDLVLLDRRWSPGQHKADFNDVYSFIDENGKEVDCSLNGINRMTLHLEPGDFLTFTGGPIWHLVEEVKGEKGRISVGGFIGFSKNDDEILCWA
jgi:hypothetical protein